MHHSECGTHMQKKKMRFLGNLEEGDLFHFHNHYTIDDQLTFKAVASKFLVVKPSCIAHTKIFSAMPTSDNLVNFYTWNKMFSQC